MVCIYCGLATRVTNSRSSTKTNSVWRRRSCTSCHALFTTVESIDYSKSWLFESKNGRLRPFVREKLQSSIQKACEHLKQPETASAALTNTVISKLISARTPTISRHQIVETTTKVLQRYNKAAATAYSAFHPI